jgi:hypothetical protein
MLTKRNSRAASREACGQQERRQAALGERMKVRLFLEELEGRTVPSSTTLTGGSSHLLLASRTATLNQQVNLSNQLTALGTAVSGGVSGAASGSASASVLGTGPAFAQEAVGLVNSLVNQEVSLNEQFSLLQGRLSALTSASASPSTNNYLNATTNSYLNAEVNRPLGTSVASGVANAAIGAALPAIGAVGAPTSLLNVTSANYALDAMIWNPLWLIR